MENKINLSKDKIARFCEENHIIKLSFFGSILRSDFSENSDIDVLVEFDKNHIPGFIRLANIQNALSKLFGGREIDIRTPNDLSPYIRDKVLNTAEVQYVQR